MGTVGWCEPKNFDSHDNDMNHIGHQLFCQKDFLIKVYIYSTTECTVFCTYIISHSHTFWIFVHQPVNNVSDENKTNGFGIGFWFWFEQNLTWCTCDYNKQLCEEGRFHFHPLILLTFSCPTKPEPLSNFPLRLLYELFQFFARKNKCKLSPLLIA